MQNFTSRATNITNTVLEADYYRQRSEEATARRTKKVVVVDERLPLIAKDLRLMPQYAVKAKWHIGPALLNKILGDMSLGKY